MQHHVFAVWNFMLLLKLFSSSCCCGNAKGGLTGKGQFIHYSVVGQVEAVARVGKSADHRWGGSAEIGPRQSPLWAVDPEIDAVAEGPRLFLGRPGILTAVRRGELAIGVDQASIHQELTGQSRVTQLLQERIDLLTPQRP
jgi:hypothetical protein